MDLGSTLFRAVGLTGGLAPQLIGRWFALLVQGRPVIGTIDAMPPIPGEIAIAAGMHYMIGTALTIAFLMMIGAVGFRHRPRSVFALAIVFGLVTNLLPWLWMFPAMGYGSFGRSAPSAWLLMPSSLVYHLIFGLGLALSTRWLGLVGPRFAPGASASGRTLCWSNAAPIGE
jgi:hypothetical protein